MDKNDFLHAFTLLGERLDVPVHLVLTGGSALILAGHVDRHTGDVDAIHADPKLSAIRNDIEGVAEEIGVQGDWLNDGARAWLDVLPKDFKKRTRRIGDFGRLTVDILGRRDLILLKLAAGRPRDLDDVSGLRPTAAEIAFVEAQLDRLAKTHPERALRIQLYLEQGESGSQRNRPANQGLRKGRRSGK